MAQGATATAPALSLDLSVIVELSGKEVSATATLPDGTLTFALEGSVSVGEILNALVDLVEPGRVLELETPWDALTSITLTNPSFVLGRTHLGFGLDSLSLNLKFVSLTSFHLNYFPKTPTTKKRLEVSLDGTLFGQKLDKPFTWDLLRQPPPTTAPVKAAPILDLEYLGLGQHISLRQTPTTMAGIIDALEGSHKELPAAGHPLATLTDLKFDAASNWLVGARFTVLGTVALSIVFNDPKVYGLVVSLSGARAKSLAGLSFEILYRKISPDIGVYHLELKLPDVMRRFELGAATLTLPIIDIDIYTDGSFLIDFGFPHNHDYSRSFTIELIVLGIPVLGAGGFYFGVLSPQASTDVPLIDNGEFRPIVVFGVGLKIGLGKTIDKGLLKAGFTLTVEGILEGVLAFFQPADPAVGKDTYFKITGSVALVGHLYGSIDFAVVKAQVDVLVFASVQLVYEIYSPAQITLEAGVSIRVSLTIDLGIFSVDIHFSFSATIRAEFSVGSASPTPWHVAAGHTLLEPLLSIEEPLLALAGITAAEKVTIPLIFQLVPTVGSLADGTIGPQLVAVLFIRMEDFDQFVATSLGSLIGAGTVTLDRLQSLATDPGSITPEGVEGIVKDRFTFTINAPPSDAKPDVTVFPMLPEISMATGGRTTDFGSKAPCSANYLQFLSRYFRSLSARAEAADTAAQSAQPSLAACLQADWRQIVLRHAAQDAVDGFQANETSEQLTGRLRDAGVFHNCAGTAARFLMHGLRLPDPATASAEVTPAEPVFPLYALSGQQFTPVSETGQDKVAVTLKVGDKTQTLTVTPSEKNFIDLFKGFKDHAPDFDPRPRKLALTEFPPLAVIPKRFALGKPVAWPAASREIYTLPAGLRAQIAADSAPALDLQLLAGEDNKPSAEATAIAGAEWAVRVDFTVKRVNDADTGQPVPCIYEISSTDLDGRADLQNLRDFLTADDQATIELLYPDASNGTGLVSETAPVVTILRTNLSTSARVAATPPPAVLSSALLTGTLNFLALLWESSAVTTGGFYLFYKGTSPEGLPATLFAQSATVTVTLLAKLKSDPLARSFHNSVICAPQTKHVFVERLRYRVQNGDTLRKIAASLGIGVDELGQSNATTPGLLQAGAAIAIEGKASYILQHGDDLLAIALATGSTVSAAIASAADLPMPDGTLEIDLEKGAGWVAQRPTMPPGNAGFRLVMKDPGTGATPAERMQSLFSLLGFQILGEAGFNASPEGLPAGPSDGDNRDPNPLPGSPWIYQQVLAIAPYAKAQRPANAAIPGQDPYAGLGTSARLSFQFHDVFGNRCLAPEKALTLDLPVGYSDPVIGLEQWPGLLGTFAFTAAAAGPQLRLALEFDAGRYAAAGASIADRADADRKRYQQIFFQITQADVAFAAHTTIDSDAPHALPAQGFVDFAVAAHNYALAMSLVEPVTDEVSATDTFGSIAARWNISPASLGAANQTRAGLLAEGSSLTIPSGDAVEVAEGDTLASIAQAAKIDAATVAGANTAGPVLQPVRVIVPGHLRFAAGAAPPAGSTDRIVAGDTLARIAARNGVPVQDLALANQLVDGLLQPGGTFSAKAFTVTARANDNLATVLARFQALAPDAGITLADVVAANQDAAGLLQSSGTVRLLTPPATIAIPAVAITVAFPDVAFPLRAAVRISRTAHLHPLFAGHDEVVGAESEMRAGAGVEDGAGLRAFAEGFEAAFPQLKLAVGRVISDAGPSQRAKQLFAVQFHNQAFDFQIQPQTFFFAPKPLLNATWSADGVDIAPYGNGTLGATVKTNFRNIDLDAFARDFLRDMDLFLSPQSAVAGQRLDPASFAKVVEAKDALAKAIRETVGEIVASSGTADLDAAKEVLYERLLVRLSDAYAIDAIVQFPVSVTYPAAAGPARISLQPAGALFVISATDTLASIAAAFQADLGLLARTIAGAAILDGADNTLSKVAQKRGVSVEDVARDAANPPALKVGAPLNLVRRSHTTAAGETLRVVLEYLAPVAADEAAFDAVIDDFAAMNAQANLFETAGLTVTSGSVKVNLDTDNLKANVAVSYLALMPAFTASEGKIDLKPGGGKSSLTFAFDSTTDTEFRSFGLTLGLQANRLEQHLSTVAWAPGYEASEVLTLVRPADEPSQTVAIPVPLRASPVPPSVVSQAVSQEEKEHPTLDDLKSYQYSFTYSFQAAAQDDVFTGVSTNLTDFAGTPAVATILTGDLPGELAQYQAIAAALKQDLGPGTAETTAAAAWGTLAGLAEKIAAAWTSTSIQRPQHLIRLPNGESFAVEGTETSPVSRFDIIRAQNVLGSVGVTRNERLVAQRPTNPEFIYVTPEVRFTNPLVPLFSNQEPFDIASLTAPTWVPAGFPAVARQLAGLFAGLLEITPASDTAASRDVRVAVSYEFTLTGSEDAGITTVTPVVLTPKFGFDPQKDLTGLDGFSLLLANELQDWLTRNNLAPGGGRWLFDISLYSSLGGSAPSPSLPLLELSDLFLAT